MKKFRLLSVFLIATLISIIKVNAATVVDIIVNSEDHTTLEAAVVAAELADDLSGEGSFTVFAPTDAAFAALPEGTVDALLEDPTGDLAGILLYHVVGAKALSTDLSDGQVIETLLGKDVEVKIMDGKVYINGAMVSIANIEADNGVVHVIDAVLLPPTVTVVDIIVNSEDHTTLEAAVVAAELADDLSGEGSFTVFAPTDAAFAALPEGTVGALLEDPTGDLAGILLYHVVGAKALSTDLSDGQVIETLLGKDVEVKIMDGKVYINGAMVSVANIEADNGVVHVIDAVLIPEAENATAIFRNETGNIEIDIYPMPASSYLNVDLQGVEGQSQIQIVELTGKVVYRATNEYSQDVIQLDIQNLNTGMHILNIINSDEFISKKLQIIR